MMDLCHRIHNTETSIMNFISLNIRFIFTWVDFTPAGRGVNSSKWQITDRDKDTGWQNKRQLFVTGGAKLNRFNFRNDRYCVGIDTHFLEFHIKMVKKWNPYRITFFVCLSVYHDLLFILQGLEDSSPIRHGNTCAEFLSMEIFIYRVYAIDIKVPTFVW